MGNAGEKLTFQCIDLQIYTLKCNFFSNIISVAAADLYIEMLIFHQHCFSICCWSIHLNVNFSPAMFLLLLLVYTMTCLFFTSNVSVAVSDLYIEMLFFH